MRHDAKAVSRESNQGAGIASALFGRSLATRGASIGTDGSGAPSFARVLSATVFAVALLFALVAVPAQASYKETANWPIKINKGNGQTPTYDIASDGTSVFSGLSVIELGSNTSEDGAVYKWNPDGTAGTPAFFGDTFSANSQYAGVAVDSTNGNIYALVDPRNSGQQLKKEEVEPKVVVFEANGTVVTSFPVSITAPTAVEGGGGSTEQTTEDGTAVAAQSPGIDVDAAGNVYVPDPSEGVVNKYDASGNLLDTTSGTTLNHPIDVAVDASGNLYVADRSTDRVNEQQTVDFEGNNPFEGTYRLSFEGQHTGADFTGDLSYAQGTGDINVAESEATRSVLGSTTGDLVAGSATVSNVGAVTGALTAGESISGSGIQLGTTIASCAPSCAAPSSITLSKAATGTGAAKSLTSGSKVLTGVTNAAQFEVGMGIVGREFGPPVGYQFQNGTFTPTVTAVNVGSETVTISDGVTSAGTGPVRALVINNVATTSGAFEAAHGQKVKGGSLGAGFVPVGIVAVNGNRIVVADQFSPEADETGVTFEAAGNVIFNVNVTSGQFSPELELDGPGLPESVRLSRHAYDALAHTVEFSNSPFELALSEGGTGVTFHADISGLGNTVPVGSDRIDSALAALPNTAAAVFPGNSDGIHAESKSIDMTGEVVTFQWALGGRDMPQLDCESGQGKPLSGGTGECSVTTTVNGSSTPGRVAKFDSSGNFVSNLVPPTGSYTADAIAVDKSSGDIFVAGGNGDWANPNNVVVGPNAPEFSIKRYDPAGNELEELGAGDVSAATYVRTSNGSVPQFPAFGLGYSAATKTLYSVGRAADPEYNETGSVARAYTLAPSLNVTVNGTGTGSVDADSGAIANCTKSGGACTDDYLVGETVVLTATPGTQSTVSWSGCDSVGGVGNTECTVQVDEVKNVTATFTLNKYSLDLTVDGGGTGTVTSAPSGINCNENNTPDCTEEYDFGTNVILTAAPGPSSAVTWTGCDTTSGDECEVEVLADTAVTATFKFGFNVSVAKNGTGTGTVVGDSGPINCGATCSGAYDEGTILKLTATPAAHVAFAGWSGGCDAEPSAGVCEVEVDSAKSLTATFNKIQHNVSVTKAGTGSGTVVAGSGPINCGATCSGLYDEGTPVVLTATPAAHSTFTSWSGCDSSTANQCTVDVEGVESVTATFNKIQHNVSVTKAGTGSGTVVAGSGPINCGATCSGLYDEGTPVVLTATPAAHSTFTSWSGCDSSTANQCTVDVEGVESVTATFTQIQHLVSVAKNGTGGGTVVAASGPVNCGATCSAQYDEGTPVVLTATAATHSTFAGWSGCDSTSGNQCTVNVDAVENVTATFNLISHGLNLTVGGNGAGKVDADFGAIVNCTKSGGTCTDSQIEGTTIILTATPSDSHSSVSWSGCDSKAGNECTVTLDSDKAVTATFSLDSHGLTVAKAGSGSGSIACDGGSCSATYVHGTSVTLTATADSGSQFSGWSGGGCSGAGACTVTLGSDVSVTATFEKVTTPPGGGNDQKAEREAQLAACVKQASDAYKKALRKAKAKHGKAKGRAKKAAKKTKAKAVASCNARFGG